MHCLHVKSYGIIQLFRDKAPDINSPGLSRCDIGEQEITDGSIVHPGKLEVVDIKASVFHSRFHKHSY